jgi:hypothetical protein
LWYFTSVLSTCQGLCISSTLGASYESGAEESGIEWQSEGTVSEAANLHPVRVAIRCRSLFGFFRLPSRKLHWPAKAPL